MLRSLLRQASAHLLRYLDAPGGQPKGIDLGSTVLYMEAGMTDGRAAASDRRDSLDAQFAYPIHGRLVPADEIRFIQGEAKGSWVPIHPPVGPWHSPQDIRAWIGRLETRRAEAGADHADTEVVDAALEQARGWLEYSERRFATWNKPQYGR
jgi:hypothetical protein